MDYNYRQKSHQNLFLLFFVILQSIFQTISSLNSNELCLNKTCSGCIAGSLSCQEGGLTHLPDRLSSDIQSMILMGHKFNNPTLTSDNFSTYIQQNVKLQRLTLRNCGIQSIQSRTFQSLKSLQQLDLSQNRIKTILKGTFEGLHLDFLRLDENFGLSIEEGAFQDTSIVSLSMNQCGLKTLSYNVLLPLINSKQLKNLHISGNQLITLESRLEPIFLHLQSLSLEQNPFNCDCKLSWLVSLLNKRQVQRRTRGLSMFSGDIDEVETNLLHRSNSLMEMNQHNTPLDGDLLKPLCHNPRRLIGRSIESLTVSDFYCGTPKLQIIEVDLGQLTTFYQNQNNNKKLTSGKFEQENDNSLIITVRCHVKGSPELQMDWYRPINHDNSSNRDQLTNIQSYSFTRTQHHPNQQQLIRIPNSKILRSGGIELKLSRKINLKDDNSLKQFDNQSEISTTEKLICFATDSNGNTSAEIVFHWPTIESLRMISDNFVNLQTKVQNHHRLSSDINENIINTDKTRITNDRSTGNYEITPGWYTVLQDDPENMLFQKQFSVLEMIGAVVGTFTVTLTLFIFGCCLLRIHKRSRYKVRSKILLHHTTSENSYRTFSPASENLKSPPHSSTSNHLLTNNFITGNGTLVNEFNGMKHLPYVTPTYEPINSTGDFQTSTGYSDSQTYDLPRILPTHSPPTIPLPPLPNGFINNATQSINDDINRCVDTSILSPFLMNDTQTLSAAMSTAAAAATLNLHMKHQQQYFNSNHNRNPILQHNQHFTQNNTNDKMIVQNQLIDLITRQNLFNQQLHDIQH
ncbi:hypothetical protein Smp_008710 [Schistosoma mansoni]|uniref:hypothetical protein n=1 Tax=Schistosoma mansoni TaxID=6183 RepID=UPI0001A645B3|nr:hypothetical protein Smp_008710 [Schistosoma mansoni]|eukprot:XP_018651842.1 hypothetical protein Smp_008710 [Schistosoma mansoni]